MLSNPTLDEIFDHVCPSCESRRQFRIGGPHPGGHHAKIQCADCGRFIKWEAKPSDITGSHKRKSQAKLLNKYSKGFCELCLRTQDTIPSPQTLEVHHVVPVEMGGGSDRENLQIVCTACHRLIHHQRTYLGHYAPAANPLFSANGGAA